jgi:hypothetical protein
MHSTWDEWSAAVLALRAHSDRFRGLRLALGRYGDPYAPNLSALITDTLDLAERGNFVRAAAAAAEQEDAAGYFMRSAAHEALASGDLGTNACV